MYIVQLILEGKTIRQNQNLNPLSARLRNIFFTKLFLFNVVIILFHFSAISISGSIPNRGIISLIISLTVGAATHPAVA